MGVGKNLQLQLTSGFREVFAKQKFGWKKLQVSEISKSLLSSPLGLIFSATMPKAKNQSRIFTYIISSVASVTVRRTKELGAFYQMSESDT